MSPLQHVDLPLRGLAGEGAQATVDEALKALPGIRSARADIVAQVLRVEYDAERVTAAEIHDALRRAGIVHVADAHVPGRAPAPDDQR